MDIRTDYTIFIAGEVASILFTNAIDLDKINRIVNTTDGSVLYNTETNSIKTNVVITGNVLTFALFPKNLKTTDSLSIEYNNTASISENGSAQVRNMYSLPFGANALVQSNPDVNGDFQTVTYYKGGFLGTVVQVVQLVLDVNGGLISYEETM